MSLVERYMDTIDSKDNMRPDLRVVESNVTMKNSGEKFPLGEIVQVSILLGLLAIGITSII